RRAKLQSAQRPLIELAPERRIARDQRVRHEAIERQHLLVGRELSGCELLPQGGFDLLASFRVGPSVLAAHLMDETCAGGRQFWRVGAPEELKELQPIARMSHAFERRAVREKSEKDC